MATAVHAIRQATPQGPATGGGRRGRPVAAGEGLAAGGGASGWICLDNYGNPYDKAVPIVELAPDGSQRFVQIAWPEGQPPQSPCLPPKRE